MLSQGLDYFKNKRVLLLQGPVGPFFYRLNKDLRKVRASVFKVNFNAGDWLFYPRNCLNFRGDISAWPAWFASYIKQEMIDTVIFFGDCRPIHFTVRELINNAGLEMCVFEEGYIRPNHITFEKFGVNDNSLLEKRQEFYSELVFNNNHTYEKVGSAYWNMIFYGFIYALAANLGKPFYHYYQHHRDMGVKQIFPWVRSVFRKKLYQITERQLEKKITDHYEGRFFLVPLQLEDDYQLKFHSDLKSINDFIELTIKSFAAHAPLEAILIFKHHYMDRGHRNYQKIIQDLSGKFFINDRVCYIHDLNLPRLLDASRGVLVINSTVGLSALIHKKPVKALGRAIYNFEGLTFQGTLDDFWKIKPGTEPAGKLVRNFLWFLVENNQLNGSFYKRFKSANNHTGLKWRGQDKFNKKEML